MRSISNLEPNYFYKETSIYKIVDNDKGLIHLLKSFISKKDLINTSINEWQKTIQYKKINGTKKKQIEKIKNDTKNNSIEEYNNIYKIINSKGELKK